MNLILHEAPRLLANILILQPIDERYIWMPTTAILGEPIFSMPFLLLPIRQRFRWSQGRPIIRKRSLYPAALFRF
ncbi:MAG: hypothetical protein NT070_22050 [Cyanobacteria bacterium]|nr:hypothetical protein [Cyanobacteriota bacterium]